MDVYCRVCSEPWENDTIHDFIEQRNPDKPWYQEEKPTEGYNIFQDKETGLWLNSKKYADEFYTPAYREFQLKGCEFFDASHNEEGKRNPLADMIYEIEGDDVDAAASDFQDYGSLFS